MDNDRRVRRTKRHLKQALAELMQEKKFPTITVRDIADRADVNRGTFYAHFESTYELLSYLENETLADFQSMIDQYEGGTGVRDLRSLLTPICAYMETNLKICRCLFQNRAASDFIGKFQELIYQNGSARLQAKYPHIEERLMQHFFSFTTFGMIGILKEWMNGDAIEKKEVIVSHAAQMISGAAESLLQSSGTVPVHAIS